MRWKLVFIKTAGLALFLLMLFVSNGYSSTMKTQDSTTGLSIQEILKKADEARGNRQGISWQVSVASSESKSGSDLVFNVTARGFDTLAESLAPAKDKGNKILMVNGNMWFYKPGLSKAVPISRRQKLVGNAAYGDIASTNYADDYEATTLTDETVNQELCHVFSLKSKTKRATYDRIEYWISKKSGLGIKAEYFTVSGKKFKTADMKYENHVRIDKKNLPFISEIQIKDVVMKQKVTTLLFGNARIGKVPNYMFNRNLLKK
jgi:hypothetical protein